MSDLLNSASLVMIPSGYKEDVVYSQIPTDGSGDMAFTRASNGTRVNSAGLVEVVPWNDLTYSEDFTNAAWTKITSTVTANSTTAPNGTNTATKFESVASGVPQLSRAITGTNTISIYAKAGNISSFRLWIGSEVIFDLSTGTVTAGTATMENVGNGWYRCIISSTNAGSVNPYFVSTASGQFVYVWGAQLNIGSTAKPYFPTTDRLNVPRLTYQNGGGGCPSLLLEKQSTNYIIQSENFTTFWSFANLLYTANQAISPDGTQNATKLSDTNGTGQHRYFQYVLGSLTNQTLSFSIYAKQGTHRYISWGITDDSDYRGQVVVDLQTGTITDQNTVNATLSNLSVVSQGDGWYKISGTIAVSSNYSGGNAYGFGLMLNSSSWSTAGYTGNDTNFYAWGAQVEQSSYPTSYIPTTSSSATRVADLCAKTGISSLIGQTEGVMFADFVFTNNNTIQVIMSLHDNANNKRIEIWANASSLTGFVGGSSSFNIASITATSGTRYKVAVAYKSGDSAYYVNGTQIGTDSTTFTISLTSLIFNYWGGSYPPDTKINEAIIFPTRLTNAELASLTTI